VTALVRGSPDAAKDFGGVHSLPAAYIFDGQGHLVLQEGGEPGPNGRNYLRLKQLEQALK
jgi:hypothetical protein